MDAPELLNEIRILSNTNSFFKSLYEILIQNEEDRERFLHYLESRNINNIYDLIKHYE